MSALPTPEEIAEICSRAYHERSLEPIDRRLAVADALLARLRPAWDELKMLKEGAEYNEGLTRAEEEQATMEANALRKERDLLRASLARKDEALRACVEALAKIKEATGTAGTLGRQEILDAIFGLADAALAHLGVKEATS